MVRHAQHPHAQHAHADAPFVAQALCAAGGGALLLPSQGHNEVWPRLVIAEAESAVSLHWIEEQVPSLDCGARAGAPHCS